MTNTPCQFTFRGMDASEAARTEVQGWFPRLGPLIEGLTGAHVSIEAVEQTRKQPQYRVRMELAMPNRTVTVLHDDPSNASHDDVHVAIRNAFRAARLALNASAQVAAQAERVAVGDDLLGS
ncbi:MAG TPA: HPF/RaiA family ribosome-associated protein [Polyangia bacterium]|jgi:hypothetical protein|nr:HPF/RaiA family ribosome-associated protein [Polyangia bacterium]